MKQSKQTSSWWWKLAKSKSVYPIVGLTIIIVMLFVVGILPPESRFIFDKYIDTEFTKDFTWENFDAISSGMTEAEVKDLLGEPFRVDFDCWKYTQDGKASFWDFAWYGVGVCFENRLVKFKTLNEFHD